MRVASPAAQVLDLESRIERAGELLRACVLCVRRCGVDRSSGERGYCGCGQKAHLLREFVSYAEELELLPSHLVYLPGCNLRCCYCVVSRANSVPNRGAVFDPAKFAPVVRRRIREEGSRSLQLLGGEPTVHILPVLELLKLVRGEARIVLDTNMYYSDETAELLDGLVDVYLADFKFGNDACARRLADGEHYLATVKMNLLGLRPGTNLIVRHILLPGHMRCCGLPVLEWLGRNLPGVKVSLWQRYVPKGDRARQLGLGSHAPTSEVKYLSAAAQDAGLVLVE